MSLPSGGITNHFGDLIDNIYKTESKLILCLSPRASLGTYQIPDKVLGKIKQYKIKTFDFSL